jgi:4-hydroxythreonine-4-phosphate dehydrogenase
MTPSRIGICLGDPGGVGPEVVLKALLETKAMARTHALVVFGDRDIVEAGLRELRGRLEFEPWDEALTGRPGHFIFHIGTDRQALQKGRPAAANGAASFAFFEAAVKKARRGALDAVVTGPVSKEAWSLAGIGWRGHTDYFEHLQPSAKMTFWSDELRLALFSHHLPLKEALGLVRKEALVRFLAGLHNDLAELDALPAEFLLAGLNPHAGEDGLLGREEKEEIVPAVEEARRAGIPVTGPYPPDSVLLRAFRRPGVMAVSLYHDQGLAGFKLVSFRKGVNVTLGLPFVRTSPDHGTGFDLAGRGVADPGSMIEALLLAARFAAARKQR